MQLREYVCAIIHVRCVEIIKQILIYLFLYALIALYNMDAISRDFIDIVYNVSKVVLSTRQCQLILHIVS